MAVAEFLPLFNRPTIRLAAAKRWPLWCRGSRYPTRDGRCVECGRLMRQTYYGHTPQHVSSLASERRKGA